MTGKSLLLPKNLKISRKKVAETKNLTIIGWFFAGLKWVERKAAIAFTAPLQWTMRIPCDVHTRFNDTTDLRSRWRLPRAAIRPLIPSALE